MSAYADQGERINAAGGFRRYWRRQIDKHHEPWVREDLGIERYRRECAHERLKLCLCLILGCGNKGHGRLIPRTGEEKPVRGRGDEKGDDDEQYGAKVDLHRYKGYLAKPIKPQRHLVIVYSGIGTLYDDVSDIKKPRTPLYPDEECL